MSDFKKRMQQSNTGVNHGQVQTFLRPNYTFHQNFWKELDCKDKTIPGVGRHYITPEGKQYPSITTVLSKTKPQKEIDSLNRWRKRVGEEEAAKITKGAASRGSSLHSLVETFLCTDKPEVTLEDKNVPLFSTVYSTISKRINQIHAIERPLYSNILKIAGRVDCIAEFDGKLSIIDFKSSTKPRKDSYNESYNLQCCFYGIAYQELFGLKVEQSVLIVGIPGVEECQVFVSNPRDSYKMLAERRNSYYSLLK